LHSLNAGAAVQVAAAMPPINTFGHGSRSSAKESALRQLGKIREVSKEMFRNIHHTARTGRDEAGGTEKAESLAAQRDSQIEVLRQMQAELRHSVSHLKSVSAHQAKMAAMRKRVREHEAALGEFGQGLKKAENILTDGLRRFDEARAGGMEPVEVEVDDVLQYSHAISYSCAAREGWEPNTPLSGALPPAPHASMMARSRLFSAAVRPGRAVGATAAAGGGAASLAAQFNQSARGRERGGGGLLGLLDGEEAFAYEDVRREKRGRGGGAAEEGDDSRLLRLWGHDIDGAADERGGAARRPGRAVEGGEDSADEALPEPVQIPPAAAQAADKDKDKRREGREPGGDAWVGAEEPQAGPRMPKGWLPGDPVLVSALG